MSKKMLTGIVLFLLMVVLAGAGQGEVIKFARYPHSCGDQLAFYYHGDIWVADLDGSGARRLTDHVAMDTFPRFSPDGKLIAFNSDRMGNGDVWVIPAAGGAARQMTFNTTGDSVQYWTPDGEGIIIATSRSAHAWMSPLHIVPTDGGIPVAMDMDSGQAGMISQDGSKLAFNRNSVRYWRNQYKGNSQTDVWVQDLGTKEITQLTDLDTREFRSHVQDAYPMWGADGMIYFLSERSGIFNIWKIAPDGSGMRQVTSHEKDGVQFPSISPDGKVITYENEFDLWKLEAPRGRPERIVIDLEFDVKNNMVSWLTADNAADGFSPSPTGDYAAVDYHGEIYIVPSEDGVGEKTQMTSSGWRDRYENWSPDGKYIAFASDESLEEEIWLYEAATGEKKKVTEHESSKSTVVWSKDSKQLAWVGANTLFVYDLARGENTRLGYNVAGGYSVREFSPDGKWLVYSRSDEDQNSEVFLYDIGAKKEINITQNPFNDSGGYLTPDGKKVVFTSNRDAGTNHLFVLPLEKVKENANDPLVKERKKKEKAEKKEAVEFNLVFDLEGIDRRAVQLTRGATGVGSYFLSEDGKTIYYTGRGSAGAGGARGGGGQAAAAGLYSIGIDGENQKLVTEGGFSGITPTADGKMVFYREGAGVYKMKLPSGSKDQVTFNFKVKVDQRAEWEQVFEEGWRVMKYRFYDENMHGVDWAGAKAKYKPYLKYVGENQDLVDLSNEMIGELNASHTGMSGPRGAGAPATYTTRQLGFEMAADRGRYRVTHIYRDGPADKEWIDLKVGDYVLAIDGKEVRAGDNYWKILNEKINDFATVRVSSSSRGRSPRDIRVETITSLGNIKYEEFVHKCREFVDEQTKGEIAYVHIRSMNQASLGRFENEIDQYWNKKGIIIDIRYNGGGNIDEPLLDILERKPYAFVNQRTGARTWGRRHRQTVAGPKVMMTNHRSFSDAEMTPAGFRVLELGRLVGAPTGGGVIWTGSSRLLNGGSIRTPFSLAVTYDATKPNNYGINLENYGVAPDVFVENTPEDEMKGYDRELKAAIDEVLRMLKEEKNK